jgi:hypothetical protein
LFYFANFFYSNIGTIYNVFPNDPTYIYDIIWVGTCLILLLRVTPLNDPQRDGILMFGLY